MCFKDNSRLSENKIDLLKNSINTMRVKRTYNIYCVKLVLQLSCSKYYTNFDIQQKKIDFNRSLALSLLKSNKLSDQTLHRKKLQTFLRNCINNIMYL